MQEPDIDIESLRLSNTDRLAECFSGITHLGWHSTTATVLTCRPVRIRRNYNWRREPLPTLSGYIVEFSYVVNGTTYTGVLDSPYAVELNDQFHIRYDPVKPGENNSLGSS
jgi:hypothetical protein